MRTLHIAADSVLVDLETIEELRLHFMAVIGHRLTSQQIRWETAESCRMPSSGQPTMNLILQCKHCHFESVKLGELKCTIRTALSP